MDYTTRSTSKALIEAARQPGDRFEAVRALIEKAKAAEVPVDTPDLLLGRSALHYAALKGHDQVVDVLLQAGASLTQKDKRGQTPLHLAVTFDCTNLEPPCSAAEVQVPLEQWLDEMQVEEATKALQENGIVTVDSLQKAYDTDQFGTAFAEVSQLRPFTRVKLGALLKRRANAIKTHYSTAGPRSGKNTNVRPSPEVIRGVVKILLRAGANPSTSDHNNETPIDICIKYNRGLLKEKLQKIANRIQTVGVIATRKYPAVAKKEEIAPKRIRNLTPQQILRQVRTEAALGYSPNQRPPATTKEFDAAMNVALTKLEKASTKSAEVSNKARATKQAPTGSFHASRFDSLFISTKGV